MAEQVVVVLFVRMNDGQEREMVSLRPVGGWECCALSWLTEEEGTPEVPGRETGNGLDLEGCLRQQVRLYHNLYLEGTPGEDTGRRMVVYAFRAADVNKERKEPPAARRYRAQLSLPGHPQSHAKLNELAQLVGGDGTPRNFSLREFPVDDMVKRFAQEVRAVSDE